MKVNMTAFQNLIHGLSILLLIIMCIYVIIIWNDIPNKIPIHYNELGEVDMWGRKILVWFLPILGFIMYLYIGSGVVTLDTIKVPVIMDVMSKEGIMSSMNTLAEVYKVEIMVILFYMVVNIGNNHSIPSLILPFYVLTIIVIYGYFRLRLYNLGVK